MGVGYNPKIVTDGLVLYVDAANRKSYPGSGNTVVDLSRTQSNATIYNGITYSNGAFVGPNVSADHRIDVPHSSTQEFTNQFSVSVWASSAGLYQYAAIIGKTFNSSWSDGWGMYYDEAGSVASYNGIFFYVNQWDGTNNGIFIGHDIGSNSFPTTCYTGTYDGSNVKLYVNGRLQSQAAYTESVENTTQDLKLMSMSGSYWFPGNLYAAQLYNRALSTQEVEQNFNALRGRFDI